MDRVSAGLGRGGWQWNALNVVRMILTATTVYHLFNAYRTLDRGLR